MAHPLHTMTASMASTSAHKLLVVGGNGYLGSAICKAGVARGWDVTSISSSGRPWRTPAGHSRKWTERVKWEAADAFEPDSYRELVAESSAVVHTLGILIEDEEYKKHVRNGNLMGLVSSLLGQGEGNPLMRGLREDGKGKQRMTYERMNRDSALAVLNTMLQTKSASLRPFVYISAEDIFRPFIPARYVSTKREAESEILRRCQDSWTHEDSAAIRPVLVRPGLMYHPHIRPLTTPLAVALDVSSSLHRRFGLPLPFSSTGAVGSFAESLRIPPIHVDQVAECVARAVENTEVEGVVDTRRMRQWVGLDKPDVSPLVASVGSRPPPSPSSPFGQAATRSFHTSARRLASVAAADVDSATAFSVTPPSLEALTADEDFGPETELIPIEQASINVTRAALAQLRKIAAKEPDNKALALRLAVESGGCHGYQYKMDLTEQEKAVDDYVFQAPGALPILIDLTSLGLLKGATLHFATELIGSSFRLQDNPQAKEGGACGCGVSWEANI